MTLAYWFTQHGHGGFPVERAALGSSDHKNHVSVA